MQHFIRAYNVFSFVGPGEWMSVDVSPGNYSVSESVHINPIALRMAKPQWNIPAPFWVQKGYRKDLLKISEH